MKSAARFAIVLVTAPDSKTARTLAKSALEARLAACANLVSRVESYYWWQEKIENSSEILLLFKTQKSRLAALEKLILSKHPYGTPEILSLPVATGGKKYLDWISESLKPSSVESV